MNSYRGFVGGEDHDLTLADISLDTSRSWLADFVARGRKPATVVARARALRVFSRWIVTEDYVRTDPLEKLKFPKIPHTIMETFTTDKLTDLFAPRRRRSRSMPRCRPSVGIADGQWRLRGAIV